MTSESLAKSLLLLKFEKAGVLCTAQTWPFFSNRTGTYMTTSAIIHSVKYKSTCPLHISNF